MFPTRLFSQQGKGKPISPTRPGRGRGQGRGQGPAGKCVCPSCGKKIPHRPGVPCSSENCPECGQRMIRE